MCTVIITVPADETSPVRLLAVRDEDPERPWNRLGAWWPENYPGVEGIQDARAGGAWLAADADTRRLAVLLNRHDLSDRPESELHSRGSLALESVAGRSPIGAPATHGFNLVEIDAHTARVVSWNGLTLSTTQLPPGTHMIAHDDVDDEETARIARWLPEFRAAEPERGDAAGPADAGAPAWWQAWVDIVGRSAELAGDDPEAIIRRQTFEGFRSYSLVVAVATVGVDGLEVRDAPLPTPGRWSPVGFD